MSADTSKPSTADTVADHYDRLAGVYEELGQLDGALCVGNADFKGWYHSPPTRRAGDVPEGYDGRARPWALAPDYDKLTDALDRVLYATVNYVPRTYYADSWQAYRWADDGREWNGEKPMPGYADMVAYAPFADIDLADDVKAGRPEGSVPKERIETALDRYIGAFADLCGGRDAVFALDSVGGAYVMVAPSVTAPIADRFEGSARAAIYDELTDRLNEWLAVVRENVNAEIDGLEEVFDPDMVNHKNRLYKAPLSLHKRLDGVVTPIDTEMPRYDYTPLTAVSDALIDDVTKWADRYTADYSDRVGELVAELWPEYADAPDEWNTALEAWLSDERADDTRDNDGEPQGSDGGNGGAAGAGVTSNVQEIYDALDALDPEAVAEDTIVAEWNDDANTSDDVRAFYPTWDRNCNGTANILNTDTGLWTDTGTGDQGGVVEMALIAASGVSFRRGDTASGKTWVRGLRELRSLGYDVPMLTSNPDDDMSAYYALDLKSIAAEHGVSGDVYNDPAKLLKACLYARNEYDHLADETPPYNALVAAAEHAGLRFKDPEEKILGRDSHRLAKSVYGELSPSDLE